MIEDYGHYRSTKPQSKNFLLSLLFYTGVCLIAAYLVPQTLTNKINTIQKNLLVHIPNGEKIHNMLFLSLKPQHILFQQTDSKPNTLTRGLYHIETPCSSHGHTLNATLKKLQKQGIPAKKTTYFNNQKTCETLQIGPFNHYANAQKTHVTLQALQINHHIYTER